MSLLIMGTASFAQDKTAKKPAKKETAKDAAKPQKAVMTPAPPQGKMKKDGTPDMRKKENKAAKPAAGPTKKDGTPDMRYKANKDAAKKDGAKPATAPKDAPKKK